MMTDYLWRNCCAQTGLCSDLGRLRMRKLRRFWEGLEDRPRLRGVRQELQDLLGNEFEAAAAFLGRTGDLAKRYPCPHPSGAGCPRHVLTEPDGSVRAICGLESKECDPVVLLRGDLEILPVS